MLALDRHDSFTDEISTPSLTHSFTQSATDWPSVANYQKSAKLWEKVNIFSQERPLNDLTHVPAT